MDLDSVLDFHNLGQLKLDEYEFPHVVKVLESNLNANSLKSAYAQCVKSINLEKHKDCGITLILTPKFMFLAPLVRQYATV